MKEEFIWFQKYRPKTLDECILAPSIKVQFSNFLKSGTIQNLLLTGVSGIGKTTVAKILCETLNCDYIMLNGSDEGRLIDTLRTTIQRFASTTSFIDGGTKIIILDEADYLNPESVQPALRGFMEKFSANCRFILTCNFKNKIIPHLHSRCTVIEFLIPKKDRPTLAKQFLDRAEYILKKENIQYDTQFLVKLIMNHFPDFRRILNDLQKYSSGGIIDSGILTKTCKFDVLKKCFKDKNFNYMRKWVAENNDYNSVSIMRQIYDEMFSCFDRKDIPDVVLILSKYLYQAMFVPDQEINLVACITELMAIDG